MFGLSTLLAAALASTSSTAGSVRLHLGECVPDRDLVHDFVAIEIGFDRMVQAEHAASPEDRDAVFDVYVTCESSALHVNLDPNPYDVEGRQVSNDDVASGGPRLVALNIVELIQDGTVQRRAPPPAPPPPVPVVVVREPPPPTPSIGVRIAVSPTLRFLPDPGRPAYGARAGVGIDFPLSDGLAATLLVDGGFEQSDARVTRGVFRAQVLSAALQGGGRIDLNDDFALFALIGLRGGWGWFSGRTEDQRFIVAPQKNGPWLGPLVALRLRFGGRAGISLGIEGG